MNDNKVNMKKIIIISIALSLIGYPESYAQSSNQKLDDYLIRKMKQADRIGMQAAYIAEGKLQWVGSYGVKTYQTKDQVNDSTLFMIASISKPVTALGLLKLYDRGKVDLDEDINKFLPFKVVNPFYPDNEITIRMLLAHVSSLRDNWTMLEPGYTIDNGGDSPISLEEFLQDYLVEGGKLYDKTKNFYNEPPASHQAYNNVAYALIGYLVERISGKPFNEYMNEEIFKPLNMNDTYWFLKDIPNDNIASPHNMPYKETDFKGTQILNHFGYPEYPAGQLRTTVADYAQVINLIINEGKIDGKQFIKPETIKLFLTIQYPEMDKWQAISWSYNEFESKLYYLLMPRLPSHTGLDPGMATVVSFDPENKTGAIIFTNSPTTTFKTEKILFLDMIKKLFEEADSFTKNSNKQ